MDLRLKYGDSYYKDLRKKRKTPSKGRFQDLSDAERKQLSEKGHQARWKNRKSLGQLAIESISNENRTE